MPPARSTARRGRRWQWIGAAMLAALAGVYLARDALLLRVVEPRLAPALREQLGVDAEWASLEVHVSAGLQRVELLCRGLALRGEAPLAEADVDQLRVELGPGVLLGGEPEVRGITVTGARVLVDVREPRVGPWPDTLPPLDATDVALSVRLPDERLLHVERAELHIAPAPPAPARQSVGLAVEGVQLVDAQGALQLGSASATVGWRDASLLVTGRAVWLPPDAGSVAVLDGARVDLVAPGGPRLRADVEVRELRLDRLLGGGAGAGPTQLTLDTAVDAPLAAPDLRRLLLGTTAILDARLARVDTSDELLVHGRLADGTLTVQEARAGTRGGQVSVQTGRLVLGEDWLDTRLELRARAELSDLGPLGALLAPLLPDVPPGDDLASWSGQLHGWVDVSGVLRNPTLGVDVAGEDVRLAGWLLGDVIVRATGDRRLVRVDALELRTPDSRFTARGTVDTTTMSLQDATAEVRLLADGQADLPDEEHAGAGLPVRIARRLLPGVSGEMELLARATGTLAAPVLELQACAADLQAAGRLRDVALVAELRDGVLVLRDAHAEVEGTQVQVAGRMVAPLWLPAASDGITVRIDTLSLVRDPLRLDLEAPCNLSWNGRLRIESLQLAGPAGRVHVEVRDEPAPGGATRHDVIARLESVHMAVLPETLRPLGLRADVIDLVLAAQWDEDPALPVPDDAPAPWLASAREVALHVELRADRPALDAGGLTAGSVLLRGELLGDPARPSGFLLAGLDDFGVDLPPALADLLRVLQDTGEVEMEDAPQPGEVVLVGGRGRVPERRPDEPQAPRRLGPCDLGARVELGRLLGLQSLRLDDPSGLRLDISGTVSAPLDVRALAAGGAALSPDAALALRGELASGDASALRVWLGDVNSLQGHVAIAGTLEGTVSAPRLGATLRLTDAGFRLASGLPAVEELQAEVALDGREARVVNCTGELGSAPFELTGRARLDASDDALDLRLRGEDLLVWRGQGVKVRVDADLALTGALARPAASGRITLRDGLMVRNVNVLQLSRVQTPGPQEPLFSFREPPLSRLQLDLTLDAAEPFRIENNLVRGGLVPNLHVGGTGEAPVLEGRIEVRPMRVALPGSYVDVSGGALIFRAEEPGRPAVELTGRSKVRGWDVSLVASGPYDEPLLELTSTPPLSSEDVLLLLLTGQPPEGTRATQASGAPQPTAVYLGQDLLARWTSETSGEDDDPLDKFELNYAENVTTRGSTALQVSYRLAGDAEGVGRAIYLDAEKDPYDAVNFGLRWRFRFP
jgi:TamB, inner membrane protein subunit of TAM complex